MLYSQHIDAAPLSSVMPELENAPLVVTADRRVPISKYCSIVQTSTEITKKHLVSHKDKSFDNLETHAGGITKDVIFDLTTDFTSFTDE